MSVSGYNYTNHFCKVLSDQQGGESDYWFSSLQLVLSGCKNNRIFTSSIDLILLMGIHTYIKAIVPGSPFRLMDNRLISSSSSLHVIFCICLLFLMTNFMWGLPDSSQLHPSHCPLLSGGCLWAWHAPILPRMFAPWTRGDHCVSSFRHRCDLESVLIYLVSLTFCSHECLEHFLIIDGWMDSLAHGIDFCLYGAVKRQMKPNVIKPPENP